MDQQELKNVLELHRKWVMGEDGGSRADLRFADLRSADLSSADLRSADLGSADLRSADLSSADLGSADLRSADLSSADLNPIKEDFFKVITVAKTEVLGLYDALQRGLVNGTQYQGECACLVGTIANVRHENFQQLAIDLRPNADRPAERWFLAINKGDIAQSNQVNAITCEWMREFMTAQEIDFPEYKIVAVERVVNEPDSISGVPV